MASALFSFFGFIYCRLSFVLCLSLSSFSIASPFGHRQISATIAWRTQKLTTSLAPSTLRLNILKRNVSQSLDK